jgi:hypothetical protein
MCYNLLEFYYFLKEIIKIENNINRIRYNILWIQEKKSIELVMLYINIRM